MNSINEIFGQTGEFDIRDMLADIGESGHVLTQTELTALAVTAAVGLLLCLFGLKVVRLWAALTGFGFGFAVGIMAGGAGGMDTNICLIVGLAAGIVLAALGAALYRVGIFITVFVSVSSFCTQVIRHDSSILFAVCAAAGLVAAILSVKFTEVITILATAALGAVMGGTAVYHMLAVRGEIIHILICAAFAVAGIMIQLLLESKKRKKKSLKKAAKIREETSAANEVERARAMMEDLDSISSDNVEEEK